MSLVEVFTTNAGALDLQRSEFGRRIRLLPICLSPWTATHSELYAVRICTKLISLCLCSYPFLRLHCHTLCPQTNPADTRLLILLACPHKTFFMNFPLIPSASCRGSAPYVHLVHTSVIALPLTVCRYLLSGHSIRTETMLPQLYFPGP